MMQSIAVFIQPRYAFRPRAMDQLKNINYSGVLVGLLVVVASTIVLSILSPILMIALIPPWPIWLVEFTAIVGLLTLSLRIPQQQRRRSVWLIAFLVAIVVTIALGIYWGGIGNTWSLPSVIGKFVAHFMAAALPVFSASVAIHVANRFGLGVKTTSFLSISVGLVAVLPMMVVGVFLACGLTGDCP